MQPELCVGCSVHYAWLCGPAVLQAVTKRSPEERGRGVQSMGISLTQPELCPTQRVHGECKWSSPLPPPSPLPCRVFAFPTKAVLLNAQTATKGETRSILQPHRSLSCHARCCQDHKSSSCKLWHSLQTLPVSFSAKRALSSQPGSTYWGRALGHFWSQKAAQHQEVWNSVIFKVFSNPGSSPDSPGYTFVPIV